MHTFINPTHVRVAAQAPIRFFEPNTSVVVFGDSITVGYNASPTSNKWKDKLAAARYGGGLLDKGASGTVLQNTVLAETGLPDSNNGRDRYISALTGANKRDKCYILYGVNDINQTLRGDTDSYTVTDFARDLTEIVEGLIGSYGYTEKNIFLGSPPYFIDNDNDFILHAQYVAAVRRVALNMGVRYSDIFQYMIDNGGNDLLSGDDIHPNNDGHEAIFQSWLLADYVRAQSPVYHQMMAVSGINKSGETLTVNAGLWTSDEGDADIIFTYQWKADGNPISGATNSSYALTANEVGKTITVDITATDIYGSTTVTSEASLMVVSDDFTLASPTNDINAWWDPTTNDADYMTLSGTDIVTLTDRSANSRVLVSSGTPQSTIENGNRAILLDGDDDYFSCNAFVYAGGSVTSYVVVKAKTNQASFQSVIYNEGYSSGSSFAYQMGISERPVFFYRTSTNATRVYLNDSDANILDDTFHIIKVIDTGTNVKIYVDGVLQNSQDGEYVRYPDAPDVFGLGAFLENDTSYYFNGVIGDVVFYSGEMSAYDDAGVMAELRSRWGL